MIAFRSLEERSPHSRPCFLRRSFARRFPIRLWREQVSRSQAAFVFLQLLVDGTTCRRLGVLYWLGRLRQSSNLIEEGAIAQPGWYCRLRSEFI